MNVTWRRMSMSSSTPVGPKLIARCHDINLCDFSGMCTGICAGGNAIRGQMAFV